MSGAQTQQLTMKRCSDPQRTKSARRAESNVDGNKCADPAVNGHVLKEAHPSTTYMLPESEPLIEKKKEKKSANEGAKKQTNEYAPNDMSRNPDQSFHHTVSFHPSRKPLCPELLGTFAYEYGYPNVLYNSGQRQAPSNMHRQSGLPNSVPELRQ